MGIKTVLKSKYTWIGAVGGLVFGPWLLGTAAKATGVNVNLPTFRTKNG